MAKRKDAKPFTTAYGPTFGSVVRGLRLGYHWSHKHQCFIRIGGEGPPWEIHLAPNGGIPNRKGGEHFRVWWEDPDGGASVLDMILPLRNVRGVKKPILFFVDDEGKSPIYEGKSR